MLKAKNTKLNDSNEDTSILNMRMIISADNIKCREMYIWIISCHAYLWIEDTTYSEDHTVQVFSPPTLKFCGTQSLNM